MDRQVNTLMERGKLFYVFEAADVGRVLVDESLDLGIINIYSVVERRSAFL